MRTAIWILILFAAAAALAVLAGGHPGAITLYWHPWQVRIAPLTAALVLIAAFIVLHIVLRTIAGITGMPGKARRWRQQQKEHALHRHLLDTITYLYSGRFTRSRKSAAAALEQTQALAASGEAPENELRQARVLLHLVAALDAHSLQDRNERDEHLKKALQECAPATAGSDALLQELHEACLMRAARWSLDDRDVTAALEWLARLPAGASRRTQVLRIRLKATRQGGHTKEALDTARLLAKHGGFSSEVSPSIIRSLATELLDNAIDAGQLQQIWKTLSADERKMPDLCIHAAHRLLALGGDGAALRTWLLPVWDQLMQNPDAQPPAQRLRVVQALEASMEPIDNAWLARIDAAFQHNQGDPVLQYLAGLACLRHQLWGKAQRLLQDASRHLDDPALRSRAECALAELAEQQDNATEAARMWKKAAQSARAR